MSQSTLAGAPLALSWRDYYEMCKPRVVMLMLLSAAVGSFLATPTLPPLGLLLWSLLGIALVAGSAAAVNHLADAQIDARMARTQHRPVATGRVPFAKGAAFAAATGALGMVVLFAFVNPLTAWLNFASWVGYGFIYTLWLKRATPQNIVIGGLFGAAPPLFGWAAITGTVEPGALLLVLIIFAWTPPHFWPLAIARKDEYEDIAMPMLPVTHGEQYTKWHIFFYTLIMIATTLLPFAIGMSGWLYLAAAIALGVGFLYWSVALLLDRHPRAAMETFRYSILYLMLLFVALLVDHYLLPQFVAGALPTQWGFGA